MLDTLAAPAAHPDPPAILRDKLLFLQELLYAKCISPAEYNSTKRPLVQRLAAFGVVVECPDADVGDGGSAAPAPSTSLEEWSEIDLRDPPPAAPVSDKTKHKSFVPPWKTRGKKEHDASGAPRPPLAQVDQNNSKNAASVLMAESSPSEAMPSGKAEKGKRRHLTAIFQNGGGNHGSENKEPAASMEGTEEKDAVKGKKKSSWGFDGLKKWKKAGNDEAMAGGERPECAAPRSSYSECRLEASPAVAKDAKRAKKTLRTATDADDSASNLVNNDKVLVENTKKELSRIQAELSSTNRNLNFSDQQIEAISTKLPVDKSDLKTFFPKAWCDEHGDNVIDAAKKEFKEHVEEMEKQRDIAGGDGWVAFGDNHDENFNPRAAVKEGKVHDSLSGSQHFTNPFYDQKNPFLNPTYD
uniref:Uncharacterized protein n=2 Tax=Oryza brachyantha TaxID=4533 RepID=J3N010_ORYBR